MINLPQVHIGVVAVSRDCFPDTLSRERLAAIMREAKKQSLPVTAMETMVMYEKDIEPAIKELRDKGCNAMVLFLGNFGPEGPETILVKQFAGPSMVVGAEEESGKSLVQGRGDALCGMLNCSYNLSLRNCRCHIPEQPIGTAEELTARIAQYVPVARVLLGLASLKVIGFGPRPQDFYACNAPIKPLYDLGVEVEENSELDLFAAFKKHAGDPRIGAVVEDMAKELGEGNTMPSLLDKLAQYELTLLDWMEEHRGNSRYVCFAGKCWPAFQPEFGFEPCYVHSRMAAKGVPVACEVDIYGAVSMYMCLCATQDVPAILDINNSVPHDMFTEEIRPKYPCKEGDLLMCFHCGNTAACKLKKPVMKHQIIMKRTLEPDTEPNVTRGTLEGDIIGGDITMFRLQSTAGGKLQSYFAQGRVLDVPTHSFGSIGVMEIPEMRRFYRHVLLGRHFPHHTAIAFAHAGRTLNAALRYLEIGDISYNRPVHVPYDTEIVFGDE